MGGLHRKIKGLRVKHRQQQQQTDKDIRIDDNNKNSNDRIPLREIKVNRPRNDRKSNSTTKIKYVMEDDGTKSKKSNKATITATKTTNVTPNITEKPITLDINVSVAILKLTGIVSYCPEDNKVDNNIITAYVSFKNIYPGISNVDNKKLATTNMETFVPSLPIENICHNEKINYYFASWNDESTNRDNKKSQSSSSNRRRNNNNNNQNNRSIFFPHTLKSNKRNKRNRNNNWTRSTFIPYILEITIGLIHAGGEMINLGQSLLAIDGEAVDKTFYLPVHTDQDFTPKKNKKNKNYFKQVWKKGFSLDKNPTLLMHLNVEKSLSKDNKKQVSFIEKTNYLSEESSIFEGIDDDNTISGISDNDDHNHHQLFVPKGILKSFDVNQIHRDPNYTFKTYDEYSSNTSQVSFWSSEYTDEDEANDLVCYQQQQRHPDQQVYYHQVCNGVMTDNYDSDDSESSILIEGNKLETKPYFSFNNLCGACKYS